ncbi:hypothetical protein IB233_04445 [Comamonas sp. CMM01]|uniref:LA2681 family HEPN domain-containing protein n=1 Tax=Comamonas sp. CMM01 TaxID=2769280 RepID=UPI00177A7CDB|nr:LA2681 family HEPN domain-containing protein [Comamonas sp. CMM01]MBD9530886.1 hypothetical protein [Comamonas sp. CMM01]
MNSQLTSEQLGKLRELTIHKLDTAAALDLLGLLIDAGTIAACKKTVDRALHQLQALDQRQLSDHHAVLSHYYRSNAYSALADIHRDRSAQHTLLWICPELQQQMLSLNSAISHKGFGTLEPMRQCQILTNYGNLLKDVGRVIDAIAQWDKALSILPNFGKARGARGLGLGSYAAMQKDAWHRAILAQHAYDSLESASTPDAYFESDDAEQATLYYRPRAKHLLECFHIDEIREQNYLEKGKLGKSKAERAYRAWCLKNRLVLNPLNDLGTWIAASGDELTLPGLSVKFSDRQSGALPPPIFGFFNQLKQEYVSARFMLYEGVTSKGVHFSDLQVDIAETYDYSEFSLATERIRTAFRIAYSLLDKIAFLLNSYMGFHDDLSEKKKILSFKNVFLKGKTNSLIPQILESKNIALCGLYWLSKELHDDELILTTAADARELHAIRNALEHKYIKVQEGWAAPFIETHVGDFAYTLGSHELEAKAQRVMQIARSALFYLTFAIDYEENMKADTRSRELVATMPIVSRKNSRKRRNNF